MHFLKTSIIGLSALLAGMATAQANHAMPRNMDRSVYVLGGYVYGHSFLEGDRQDDTPKHSHGFKVGFGHRVTKNVDIQFTFTQFAERDRSSTNSSNQRVKTEVDTKNLDVDMHYIFNPNCQTEFFMKAGIDVSQSDYIVDVNGARRLDTDETRVNPTLGFGLEHKLGNELAVVSGVKYVFGTHDADATGHLGAFLGLTYNL